MGYRPSQAARSLVTGRTSTLGVVVTDVTDPFVAQVMSGAESTSREAGYTLLFAMSHGDPALEIDAMRVLLDRQVDGLILVSGRAHAQYGSILGITSSDQPIVLVNNVMTGEGSHSVCMDNRGGAALAVEHLRSLGHRRISFVGGPRNGRSSREREAGFRNAMSGDLDEQLLLEGNGMPEDGAYALHRMIELPGAPTAVICYNDLTALGIIAEAARIGIQVPRRLSVVGFDDIPLSAYSVPALTTVKQPARELGMEAVRISLAALTAGHAEDRVLTGSLVIRDSAAPPE
jgi:DNA-binding LacI/PurR family transcriptional regulator